MANKHPNTSGLRPYKKQTEQQDIIEKKRHIELSRKGAEASNKKQAEKKQFKERLQIFLETPINDKLPDEYAIMNLAKYMLKPETAKEFFDAINLRLKIMGDINENQITINNNQESLTPEKIREFQKRIKNMKKKNNE